MKVANAVSIANLIKAHKEKDEEKFYIWANFIADAYEDAGDSLSAKIIRYRIDGLKSKSKCCLDKE